MATLPNIKYTVSNGIYVPEFYAKPTIVTSTPYDVLQTDYMLLINTGGGTIDINLGINDPFIEGKILYIKDISGTASTNPITIISATIDGNTPYTLSRDYQGIQIIYYDVATWFILSNIS